MQVVWRGDAEADIFNRLVTLVPCRWREANLFRALSGPRFFYFSNAASKNDAARNGATELTVV